jgi:hypothetical protein
MACIANATTEPEEHDEIVVTPEMISAGRTAYLGSSEYFELAEDIVTKIFKEMIMAHPSYYADIEKLRDNI